MIAVPHGLFHMELIFFIFRVEFYICHRAGMSLRSISYYSSLRNISNVEQMPKMYMCYSG